MCSASFCDQANLSGAVPEAARRGVGVIAKRPVANGAWKPLEAQQGLYRDYVRPYVDRFHAMGLEPAELGFAGPGDWMEIALRFALAQEDIHILSIGTTNPANAEANLKLLEKGPLPPESVARLRESFRLAETRLGATWPGLT